VSAVHPGPSLLQWQQPWTLDRSGVDTTTPACYASHLRHIDTLRFDGTIFNHHAIEHHSNLLNRPHGWLLRVLLLWRGDGVTCLSALPLRWRGSIPMAQCQMEDRTSVWRSPQARS